MARKVKKKANAQNSQQNSRQMPVKKESVFKKNKILTIIIAAILASALILGIVFGIIALTRQNEEFDYLEADLSKYVYISSDDYKNYPLDIPLVTVDESDVKREINRLLVGKKDKNALFAGASVRPQNYVIKLGDEVNLWYRGYSVDENGIKTEINGASNLKDAKPYSLEIGSGSFIKGFEEGLLGKPLHENSLKGVTVGKIEDGDILYISYSAFLSSGAPVTVSDVVIDTSDKENVDKIYGKGFAEFFIGKTIGASATETFRIEGDSVDTIYYEMKVDYAVRCESKPYIIDVVFPPDYNEESLRGANVRFEVYASTAVVYNNAPEWCDAFITETLKETAESLSDYEGETLSAKYENKIRKELEAAKESTNKALIEEEMWRYYLSKLSIKKLPKAAVDKIYLQYLAEVSQYYSVYGSSFSSFDEFAGYYLNLSEKEDWREYLIAKAESSVAEKITFYYIINEEGLLPTAEEYDSIFSDIKEEYMKEFKELYKTELEACKTEEEKAAKLLEIENRLLEYYGEEYFCELVYYKYAIEYLIGFANIIRSIL